MAGRPRKPIEIKKLQGTFQQSKEPAILVAPLEGVPPPPDWLSGRAADLYREFQGLALATNVHSAADTGMLAALATRQEEVEICTMMIEDQGRFIAHKRTTTKRGAGRGQVTVTEESYRPHPAIAQRSDALRHLQSLLTEFGLSPAARSKVGANSKAKAKNAFSDF